MECYQNLARQATNLGGGGGGCGDFDKSSRNGGDIILYCLDSNGLERRFYNYEWKTIMGLEVKLGRWCYWMLVKDIYSSERNCE